ncbi:MAG: hypothetical protein WCH32_11895 [Pseudomonadota bacterium]
MMRSASSVQALRRLRSRPSRLLAGIVVSCTALLAVGRAAAEPAPARTAMAPPAMTRTAALEHLATVQCASFAQLESSYGKQFATRMRDWSLAQMPDLQGRPVLYLFSGPDIVTTMALFPSAGHLTLVADQKPEYDLLTQADADSPEQTERECRMLSFFSRLGYYRTDDLNGKVGTRPRFIKLLAYSIAFGGGTVTSADLLAVAANGELQVFAPGAAGKPQGVRFGVRRRDGSVLTVDYLMIDLSNHGLKGDAGALAFLQHAASDVLFLKSASHLLQSPHFSVLADLLVTPPAPFVVQDETGLGIDRLNKAYQLTLYGKFTNPQALWAHNTAAHAFADEYATHEVKAMLPFTIGYEKKAGSALLIGRRTTR